MNAISCELSLRTLCVISCFFSSAVKMFNFELLCNIQYFKLILISGGIKDYPGAIAPCNGEIKSMFYTLLFTNFYM